MRCDGAMTSMIDGGLGCRVLRLLLLADLLLIGRPSTNKASKSSSAGPALDLLPCQVDQIDTDSVTDFVEGPRMTCRASGLMLEVIA
jgi:hypothetical protein